MSEQKSMEVGRFYGPSTARLKPPPKQINTINKMTKEAGKGDSPRPVDTEKYRDNYDKIFRQMADDMKKEEQS